MKDVLTDVIQLFLYREPASAQVPVWTQGMAETELLTRGQCQVPRPARSLRGPIVFQRVLIDSSASSDLGV
ncbi:hypothetical protein J6590_034621 [Homalodisca vitripennis]|nr:hypothetical protein J6590_034621 [Homalodisca vitripennis]